MMATQKNAVELADASYVKEHPELQRRIRDAERKLKRWCHFMGFIGIVFLISYFLIKDYIVQGSFIWGFGAAALPTGGGVFILIGIFSFREISKEERAQIINRYKLENSPRDDYESNDDFVQDDDSTYEGFSQDEDLKHDDSLPNEGNIEGVYVTPEDVQPSFSALFLFLTGMNATIDLSRVLTLWENTNRLPQNGRDLLILLPIEILVFLIVAYMFYIKYRYWSIISAIYSLMILIIRLDGLRYEGVTLNVVEIFTIIVAAAFIIYFVRAMRRHGRQSSAA